MHRTYVYDTEKRCKAALAAGTASETAKTLWTRFQQTVRELERAQAMRSQGDRHFRMGLPQGWFEADSARRTCSRLDGELLILARRIDEALNKG